jgi:hypothetical protein
LQTALKHSSSSLAFLRKPEWMLVLVTLLALLPFLTKPVNFDDPLFIWTARHIQHHPADPYGFKVNWYGSETPMSEVTQNPPLASYYVAFWTVFFGWSEASLHAAFLLPAIAVVLGTYRLARRLCARPLLAALATLSTPVFLVSATTLMCDVMMLAFWVWAVVFWIEGTKPRQLAFCAILIAFAALTKYFAACLFPLLIAWHIAAKRPAKNLLWLAIPALILAGYEIVARNLYGHGLLTTAASYATSTHKSSGFNAGQLMLTTLGFAGGCLAVAVFFSAVLWRPRSLAMGTTIAFLITGVACLATSLHKFVIGGPSAAVAIQIIFWASGGLAILALGAADIFQRCDAGSWLLGFWLFGTFLFTGFFNWTINGRSILPMAVPVGILIARRLEWRFARGESFSPVAIVIPIALSAVLTLWVAVSDYFLAVAVQQTAQATCGKYKDASTRLLFQGHWGFQYYMEAGGATPLDFIHARLKLHDVMAVPFNNSNLVAPPDDAQVGTVISPGPGWLTTMNTHVGAGFYWATLSSPLPFAFGRVPPEGATIYSPDVAALPAKGN